MAESRKQYSYRTWCLVISAITMLSSCNRPTPTVITTETTSNSERNNELAQSTLPSNGTNTAAKPPVILKVPSFRQSPRHDKAQIGVFEISDIDSVDLCRQAYLDSIDQEYLGHDQTYHYFGSQHADIVYRVRLEVLDFDHLRRLSAEKKNQIAASEQEKKLQKQKREEEYKNTGKFTHKLYIQRPQTEHSPEFLQWREKTPLIRPIEIQ